MNVHNLARFILIAALLSSCVTDRRLASQFVVEESNINVLLLPPPGLIKDYKVSLKSGGIDSIQTLPLIESKFLADFNDTAYVNYFFRSLKYHLSQYQVNVFGPENIDSFFQLDTTAFIFSLVQMELLELRDMFREMADIDQIYMVKLPRINIENSIWFEFSELNHPDRPQQVLYSLQRTSDIFDGRLLLDWRTNEVSYRYTPYYLEKPDVYDLAFFAGQKNAQYIFDYLMNVYVADRSKRKRSSSTYFQYDIGNHSIRRAYNDRFIKIQAPAQDER